MPDKYTSTLLPQSNEPEEIKRALLDLLAKINEVQSAAVDKPGTIKMWASGGAAQGGWLLCDGASLERAAYPDLFKALGTVWGSVDGAHFNVPDMRGVSPAGVGSQDIGGRTKTGPALGQRREDQLQNITGAVDAFRSRLTSASGAFQAATVSSGGGSSYADALRDFTFDASKSTAEGGARTGAYTHGPEAGVHFVIKT